MINRINPFYLDDTPTMPGHKVIRIYPDQFYCKGTCGSYNLLMARLLNISYADFCRLCRDEYGAVIVGKNCYYPVAYFPDDQKARLLVKVLNHLATLVDFYHRYPNFDEMEEKVTAFKEAKEMRKSTKTSE